MNLFLASLVLVSFLVNESSAMKVAMLPNFGLSHFLVQEKLGEELQRRGHEVVIIVEPEASYVTGKPYVRTLQKNKEMSQDQAQRSQQISDPRKHSTFTVLKEVLKQIARLQKIQCNMTLSSKEIMAELRQADIIVGDAMFLCSNLVADWLDLPHVLVSTAALETPNSHLYGVPSYLNYVPAMMSRVEANMGLWDRIHNLVFKAFGMFISEIYMTEMVFSELKEKYNIRPDKTTKEILASVDLLLLTKPFGLEYAQPIPPYFREVGNFMPAPARSLPSELEEFMERSGDEGVIIVSFGSMIDSLDRHVVNEMISAFSRLPQGILWRLNTDKLGRSLPPNIKAVKWLPQNDLLGHNKTRLFFTHGGANGLAEATYHGIPMVCSPLFGDQFDNAQIIVHAGIGEILEVKYASADEIFEVINTVLTQKRFKENSARVSRIQKMRPRLPVEEAADLVEYTQAVGHLDHLKPKGMSLPFYQLYMLDVIAVLVVLLGISIGLMVVSCKVAISMCFETRKKTKTS